MENFLAELSHALEKVGRKEEAKEVLAQLDFFSSKPEYVEGPSLSEVLPRDEKTHEPKAWELVDRIERLEMNSSDVRTYLMLKSQLEKLRGQEGGV